MWSECSRNLSILPQAADKDGAHTPKSWLMRPLNPFGRARAEIAMQHGRRKAALAQGGGDPFGRENRAVSPSGTAEGDVDVSLALRGVAREQVEQQVADAAEVGLEPLVPCDMRADRLVEPGQLAQLGLPVRVVEEAHVEH